LGNKLYRKKGATGAKTVKKAQIGISALACSYENNPKGKQCTIYCFFYFCGVQGDISHLYPLIVGIHIPLFPLMGYH
jgi:hypothetical protein